MHNHIRHQQIPITLAPKHTRIKSFTHYMYMSYCMTIWLQEGTDKISPLCSCVRFHLVVSKRVKALVEWQIKVIACSQDHLLPPTLARLAPAGNKVFQGTELDKYNKICGCFSTKRILCPLGFKIYATRSILCMCRPQH